MLRVMRVEKLFEKGKRVCAGAVRVFANEVIGFPAFEAINLSTAQWVESFSKLFPLRQWQMHMNALIFAAYSLGTGCDCIPARKGTNKPYDCPLCACTSLRRGKLQLEWLW